MSKNVLADSAASVGLLIAFYYGLTGFACVWFFRRELLTSPHALLVKGILPLIGGLTLLGAFVLDTVRRGVEQGRFGPVQPEKFAVLAIAVVDGMGIPLALGDPAVGPGAAPEVLAVLAELLGTERQPPGTPSARPARTPATRHP